MLNVPGSVCTFAYIDLNTYMQSHKLLLIDGPRREEHIWRDASGIKTH